GLGLAADVSTGERVGDRQPLDGEGLGDALVGEDLDEPLGDTERLEGDGGFWRGFIHGSSVQVTGGGAPAPDPDAANAQVRTGARPRSRRRARGPWARPAGGTG